MKQNKDFHTECDGATDIYNGDGVAADDGCGEGYTRLLSK